MVAGCNPETSCRADLRLFYHHRLEVSCWFARLLIRGSQISESGRTALPRAKQNALLKAGAVFDYKEDEVHYPQRIQFRGRES